MEAKLKGIKDKKMQLFTFTLRQQSNKKFTNERCNDIKSKLLVINEYQAECWVSTTRSECKDFLKIIYGKANINNLFKHQITLRV